MLHPMDKPLMLPADLLQQAEDAYERGDYDAAIALAEPFRADADLWVAAKARYVLAMVAYNRGELPGAAALGDAVCGELAAALEADPSAEPVRRLLIDALSVTGMIHASMRDWAQALALHHQERDCIAPLNDPLLEAHALSGIGGVYYMMDEFDRAYDYGQQALALYRQAGDERDLVVMLGNLGLLAKAAKRPADVVLYAEEAVALVEAHNLHEFPEIYDHALGILAKARWEQGRLDEAAALYERGLALTLAHDQPRLHADLLLDHGHLLLERGQYAHALRLLRGAVTALAGEHTPFQWMYQHHELEAKLHLALGDHAAALTAYQQFHTAKEQFFNAERDERIRRLEADYAIRAARQEAELLRARAAAAEAQQAADRAYFERLAQLRDDLLATTTHDLKNPVSSIRLNADLLRRRVAPGDQAALNYLDNINQQLTRINTLITEVLELARLETGRALHRVEQPLLPLIDPVIANFRVVAAARQLHLDFTPPVASLVAAVDAAALVRVVENLIGNAIKYTPPGGMITVTLERRDDSARLSITDTGLGIPAADLPHLFERFYRVQRPEQMDIDGTGLGLPIAHTIIQQHGGTLTVESPPPGQSIGSAFIVTLPL